MELVGQDLGCGQHTVGERCCWEWAHVPGAGTCNVGVSLLGHPANLHRSITGVQWPGVQGRGEGLGGHRCGVAAVV